MNRNLKYEKEPVTQNTGRGTLCSESQLPLEWGELTVFTRNAINSLQTEMMSQSGLFGHMGEEKQTNKWLWLN